MRLPLVVCALAACSAPSKAPLADDFTDLKSDQFSKSVSIVGAIAPGTTTLAYSNPPRYRAYTLDGGADVDIWVRTSSRDAVAWITDGSFKIIVKNDDADDSTLDSHIATTLPAGSYYLIVREYKLAKTTFTISLSRTETPPPATPSTPAPSGAPFDYSPAKIVYWELRPTLQPYMRYEYHYDSNGLLSARDYYTADLHGTFTHYSTDTYSYFGHLPSSFTTSFTDGSRATFTDFGWDGHERNTLQETQYLDQPTVIDRTSLSWDGLPLQEIAEEVVAALDTNGVLQIDTRLSWTLKNGVFERAVALPDGDGFRYVSSVLDASGRVQTQTGGNDSGVYPGATTYFYNSSGSIDRIEDRDGSGNLVDITQYTYASGRVSKIEYSTVDASGNRTLTKRTEITWSDGAPAVPPPGPPDFVWLNWGSGLLYQP